MALVGSHILSPNGSMTHHTSLSALNPARPLQNAKEISFTKMTRIVLLVLIIGSLGSQWTAIAFPLEDEHEGRQYPPLDLQHLSQEDAGALIHRLYPNFPLPASTTKGPYSAPGTVVPLVAAPPPATYPGLTNPDTYQPDPSAASTGSAPIITNDVAYSNLCFNSRFCLVPVFSHAPQEGLA